MSYDALRQEIIKDLGFFWQQVFLDSEFVEAYASSVAVPLQHLNDVAAKLPYYSDRHLLPARENSALHLFVFNEDDLDRNALHYGDPGLTYGPGTASYGQGLQTTSDYRYPIDPAFSPQFLTTGIRDPDAIIQNGSEFSIEGPTIIFRQNPLDLPGLQKRATASADGTTLFQFVMYGFQVKEDVQGVCDFFGTVAGFCAQVTERSPVDNSWDVMKACMNVAWDLRTQGATSRNIKRMLSLITGVDYVADSGRVRAIYDEGDRTCILTDNAVYTAPRGTGVQVSVGTRVVEGQEVFTAYSLRYGNEEIDFEDFEGVALGKSHLPALGGDILVPNTRVPVTKQRHPDWFTVQVL